MTIKKVEGIIVSEVDYKESSKIINILTKDDGLIGVIARGTKKVKNNFGGMTTKLTYGIFHLYYKDKGLSTLIDIDVIDGFKHIRKDINLISYACYLLELSMQVYRHENNNDIYRILQCKEEYRKDLSSLMIENNLDTSIYEREYTKFLEEEKNERSK